MIILILLLLAAIISCSPIKHDSQGPNTTSSVVSGCQDPSTTATVKGKKTLKLWFYFEGKERYEKILKLSQGYSKMNCNVEVVPEYVPFFEFRKRLSVGLAAEDLPDIVIIDNTDHAAYSALGLFADITDQISEWPDKDQYFEGPWKTVTYNQKIYGIPLGSNNLALFYNKQLLDRAGIKPPQTWEELRKDAKILSKDDVKGFGFSGLNNEEGTFQFLPWLFGAGASFYKIDSPEGVHAYSFFADLMRDQSISKEVLNWTQADVMKQFATGKLAMMVNGSWQIPELSANAPNLSYGVTLIPKGSDQTSVLGGENLGVVNGRNVEEAVKFIKYVASPEVLTPFLQSFGYFPPRKDIAEDTYWTENPIWKVFNEEMGYAEPRGPHPKWPEISSAISTALQKTLLLNTTPEDAAKEAQMKIDKLIK